MKKNSTPDGNEEATLREIINNFISQMKKMMRSSTKRNLNLLPYEPFHEKVEKPFNYYLDLYDKLKENLRKTGNTQEVPVLSPGEELMIYG